MNIFRNRQLIYSLTHCIMKLGFINGYRYWRIQRWCLKNPILILRWSEACEFEANALEAEGNKAHALLFRDFAYLLRKSYISETTKINHE